MHTETHAAIHLELIVLSKDAMVRLMVNYTKKASITVNEFVI